MGRALKVRLENFNFNSCNKKLLRGKQQVENGIIKKWYYRKNLMWQNTSSLIVRDNLDTEENLEATVSIRQKEMVDE